MAWKEYSKAKKVHIHSKLSSPDFLTELIQGEIAFVSGGAGWLRNIFEMLFGGLMCLVLYRCRWIVCSESTFMPK